jgi:RNA polymerase sigma-70 factor (ECF subfamily)
MDTQDIILVDGSPSLETAIEQPRDAVSSDGMLDDRFEAVYLGQHARLVWWLNGRTRDRALAEDIANEAFVRLLVAMRSGRAPDDCIAWLHVVGLNLVISRARRARVAQERAPRERATPQWSDPTSDHALARQRLLELMRAAARLSPAERQLITMAVDGRSTAQIARVLGIAEGAARTRLHRARKMLRSYFDGSATPGSAGFAAAATGPLRGE